ncbi:MAG: hypothetical protein RLZZ546_172, partial [Bacteroidota bacterium]
MILAMKFFNYLVTHSQTLTPKL